MSQINITDTGINTDTHIALFQVAQCQSFLLQIQETQEMQIQSLVWGDPLEEGMETHSSILAWKIPQTEEPGGYSPWGCKKSDMTEVA